METSSTHSSQNPDAKHQELLGDVWITLAKLDNIVQETEQSDYIDQQERVAIESLHRVEKTLVDLEEQLQATQDERRLAGTRIRELQEQLEVTQKALSWYADHADSEGNYDGLMFGDLRKVSNPASKLEIDPFPDGDPPLSNEASSPVHSGGNAAGRQEPDSSPAGPGHNEANSRRTRRTPNPSEATDSAGHCGRHGLYVGRGCPECAQERNEATGIFESGDPDFAQKADEFFSGSNEATGQEEA